MKSHVVDIQIKVIVTADNSGAAATLAAAPVKDALANSSPSIFNKANMEVTAYPLRKRFLR